MNSETKKYWTTVKIKWPEPKQSTDTVLDFKFFILCEIFSHLFKILEQAIGKFFF